MLLCVLLFGRILLLRLAGSLCSLGSLSHQLLARLAHHGGGLGKGHRLGQRRQHVGVQRVCPVRDRARVVAGLALSSESNT